MPLNFPSNPSVNQQSTQNGRTFLWTGYAWELVASGGGGEDTLLRSLFVPPAPTSVSASAGNAQAVVSWTAPTGVIAQAPITDYTVQFQQSGGSWETFSDGTSTATSATVTGLTNGTAYQFRVAAVNAVGTGSYSAASSAVTPSATSVPGVPTGLGIGGGSCAQGYISWTPPASNGGSAITGYRIRISTNNYATYREVNGAYYPQINQFQFSTGNPLVTGAGDIPSGSFTIRLSAVNSVGEGPYAQATATGDSTWYNSCG